MSTLESKLEQETSSSGRARATLAHLIRRWGSPPELDGKTVPEMVLVRQMGGATEYWRPVERAKTPLSTVYELVETVMRPQPHRSER